MTSLFKSNTLKFSKRLLEALVFRGIYLFIGALVYLIVYAFNSALWGIGAGITDFLFTFSFMLVIFSVVPIYRSIKTSKYFLNEIKIDDLNVYLDYEKWNTSFSIVIKREDFFYLEYLNGRGQTAQIRFYDGEALIMIVYFAGKKGDFKVKELCDLLKSRGFRKPYGHNL